MDEKTPEPLYELGSKWRHVNRHKKKEKGIKIIMKRAYSFIKDTWRYQMHPVYGWYDESEFDDMIPGAPYRKDSKFVRIIENK